MKRKPLTIVIVLIATVLMYFGFNIDLGALGINENIQSTTNSGTNENTNSISDTRVNTQYSFRTNELLNTHYEKHKDEFQNITIHEYLEGAINLINQVSETVISKTEEKDGDTLYFDTRTNEFAVLSTDDYIRTYFIPEDGIDYFNRK